jgi:hypothetical protein
LERYPGNRQELHVGRRDRATETLRASTAVLGREALFEGRPDAERIEAQSRPGARAQADRAELARVLVDPAAGDAEHSRDGGGIEELAESVVAHGPVTYIPKSMSTSRS